MSTAARDAAYTAYTAYTRSDRALEWALLCGFVVHCLTLGALAWGLRGLPLHLCVVADVWVLICCYRAGTCFKGLGWVSVPLWVSMSVIVGSFFRPSEWVYAPMITAGRAVALTSMPLWLGLAAERVLRRFRPVEAHGRLARWRHPGRGLLARAADCVANSRLIGALLEPLPALPMKSNIRDVVYVNYLVAAARLEPLVPPGLELQRLGPDGRYALFTFLTFQHQHFGVAFSDALRRLFPSPVQTNWRVHVRDPKTGLEGIYFVTNAVTSLLHAFGARLLTEGMPMHLLGGASVQNDGGGRVRVSLQPGNGSAPDAVLDLAAQDTEPPLAQAFAECWADFRAFLAYCVPQDRAMSSQPLKGRVSRQEIELGIPLSACSPLSGTVTSRAAERIVGDAAPLCFHVAAVDFHFSGEFSDGRGAVGQSIE